MASTTTRSFIHCNCLRTSYLWNNWRFKSNTTTYTCTWIDSIWLASSCTTCTWTSLAYFWRSITTCTCTWTSSAYFTSSSTTCTCTGTFSIGMASDTTTLTCTLTSSTFHCWQPAAQLVHKPPWTWMASTTTRSFFNCNWLKPTSLWNNYRYNYLKLLFTCNYYKTVPLSFGQSHRRQMPWHNWQQTACLANLYRNLLYLIEASTWLIMLQTWKLPETGSVQCTTTCIANCTLLYILLMKIKQSTYQLSFGLWPGNKSA